MMTQSDKGLLAFWTRFEGVAWLAVMCLVSLVSCFPVELPASWLVVGVGLVTLLRMGRAGLPYVALAALFVGIAFVLRQGLALWPALQVCAVLTVLVTFEAWLAWRAVVWLEKRRHGHLLSRAADVFPFALLVCLLPAVLAAVFWFFLVWVGLPKVVSTTETLPSVLLVVARSSMGLLLIGPLYWVAPKLRSTPKWVFATGWLFFSLPVFLNEAVYFGLAILAYPAAILVARKLHFSGIVVAVAVSSIFSLGYTYYEVAGNDVHLVSQWLLDTVLFSTTLGIVALYSALSFEELEARGERLEHLVSVRTSDLEQANKRLTEMASVDPLTGLANRRQWNTRAELSVVQASFTDEPLSVMLIDLDHFKRINDQHGHDVGDQVLKLFAHRCGDVLRTGDTLARLGGEEFSLMLQGADLDAAFKVAEKLHRQVQEAPFVMDNGLAVTVTASIGVAQWRQEESSLSPAMKRADQALYRAKHNGRNQVILEPHLRVPS